MLPFLAISVGCSEPPSHPPAEAPMPYVQGGEERLAPYLPDAEPIVSVPVYGGTLESAPAIGGVIAADPEGNRLLRVIGDDVAEMDLGYNARPFRVHVEDATAWVTLRGTGELAEVAIDSGRLHWRTRVCLEPRGVARSQAGPLLVACAGGELVEVDDDGNLGRLAVLEPDLRDVVAAEDHLLVSRFATAEVLEVDPESLSIVARYFGSDSVAWRMRPYGGGALVLLQETTPEPIAIDEPDAETEAEEPTSAYGAASSGCQDTIVSTVLIAVWMTNAPFPTRTVLNGVTVGTDFAMIGDDDVTIANAGAGDGEPDVLTFDLSESEDNGGCLDADVDHVLSSDGRASAVAVDSDGTIIMQSAAPLSLTRAEPQGFVLKVAPDASTDAVALFHADPGVGVSCASCHPEGLDDGHVWVFFTPHTVGSRIERRTMPLAGGILSRLPYHWDAVHEDPHALMADTFEARMGGSADPETTDALFDWLDGLRHVRSHPKMEEAAIEEGREAFAVAGCDGCHTGSVFTSNRIESIGRPGEAVKVPSLLGVGARNDLLHDGCDADLDARFDGVCDGLATHGDVTDLTPDEIDALKAFLRTL